MSGSVIYAGGGFGSIGGQPHFRLVALDAAKGARRDPLATSVAALSRYWFAVHRLRRRRFPTIEGQPPRNLAALDASPAGNATDWDPNADASISNSGQIATLAQAGDTLFVGGTFYAMESTVHQCLAEFTAT